MRELFARRADGIDARLAGHGVGDDRARALLAVIARGRDAVPPTRFDLVDYDRVDVRLLPYLVRARSLEDFVFEGISETIVRRFLKAAPKLHAMKGSVAGVRFALSLLEMTADWIHWHAESPPAAPNTYRAKIWFGRSIFEGETDLVAKSSAAARASINAMKRWSQDGSHSFGLRQAAPVRVGIITHAGGIVRHIQEQAGDQLQRAGLTFAMSMRAGGFVRHINEVSP